MLDVDIQNLGLVERDFITMCNAVGKIPLLSCKASLAIFGCWVWFLSVGYIRPLGSSCINFSNYLVLF